YFVGQNELCHGVIPSLAAASAGVRQQGNFARVLDGLGDLALLLDGDAGHATGTDLSAVGDELAQQCDVLVVDDGDVSGLQGVGLWFGLTEFSLSHRGAPLSGGARRILLRDGE